LAQTFSAWVFQYGDRSPTEIQTVPQWNDRPISAIEKQMENIVLPATIEQPPLKTIEELNSLSTEQLGKLANELQVKSQLLALYQMKTSRLASLITNELLKREAKGAAWRTLAKTAEAALRRIKNNNGINQVRLFSIY
jgi:hypothetical protein